MMFPVRFHKQIITMYEHIVF